MDMKAVYPAHLAAVLKGLNQSEQYAATHPAMAGLEQYKRSSTTCADSTNRPAAVASPGDITGPGSSTAVSTSPGTVLVEGLVVVPPSVPIEETVLAYK